MEGIVNFVVNINIHMKNLREAVTRSFSDEDIDIPMTTAKVTYYLFAVAQEKVIYLWMLMFKGARRLWCHKLPGLVRL